VKTIVSSVGVMIGKRGVEGRLLAEREGRRDAVVCWETVFTVDTVGDEGLVGDGRRCG
jgi:hypothetical protein